MATLYYESQYFTTTLSVAGGINDSVTTGIVLQAITGIHDTSKPGIALLSYADPLDTSVAEWVTFTSINSTTKTLVGVTRGQEGFSAKAHGNGVTVAFPHSKSHINNLIQQFTDELTATRTLTNKRITKRTGTTTSSATPTINTDNVDFYSLTAQAEDITSFTTNLSGTPTENQTLWIAITGTAARAITWGASFENGAVTLPTTTVSTTRLDVGFVWNTVTSKWRCMASG